MVGIVLIVFFIMLCILFILLWLLKVECRKSTRLRLDIDSLVISIKISHMIQRQRGDGDAGKQATDNKETHRVFNGGR
jgi:hypothetical protein